MSDDVLAQEEKLECDDEDRGGEPIYDLVKVLENGQIVGAMVNRDRIEKGKYFVRPSVAKRFYVKKSFGSYESFDLEQNLLLYCIDNDHRCDATEIKSREEYESICFSEFFATFAMGSGGVRLACLLPKDKAKMCRHLI